MNLRTVQQFRYTIPLIAILFIIMLIAAFISFTNAKNKEKTPLNPTYQNGESKSHDLLKPDWNKITLGTTQQEIEKMLGKPARTEEIDGKINYIYIPNPQTPLATHEFLFKNANVVLIKRSIDSFYDKVRVEQYYAKYGRPTIIRNQSGTDVYSLQSFKIKEDEYLIAETDIQNNLVYNIYILNKTEYDIFIKKIQQASPRIPHDDFEVEPI